MSTTETDRPDAGLRAAATAHPEPGPRRPAPCAGDRLRRHLRAALTGIALAAVLLTGLSAYAAHGIADALQNALCQARTTCP